MTQQTTATGARAYLAPDHGYTAARERISKRGFVPFAGPGASHYQFRILAVCEGRTVRIKLPKMGEYDLTVSSVDCTSNRRAWTFRGSVWRVNGSGPEDGNVEGFIDSSARANGLTFLTGPGSKLGKLQDQEAQLEDQYGPFPGEDELRELDALRAKIFLEQVELGLLS
ncbi:MAG: hypothetical protein WDN10_01120 [bacterium]